MSSTGTTPKITAMMLVKDRAEMLKTAARSVLTQSEADFELIILDDGSRDHTWQICEQLAHQDRRVRLLRNETAQGIPAGRNRVLKEARGEFIAICDSDDASRSERFQKQLSKFEQNPRLVGVGSRINAFTTPEPSIGYEPAWNWGLRDGRLPAAFPSMMFRTSSLREIDGFATNYAIAEDLHLCYRLAGRGGEFTQVDHVLLDYRMHEGSITQKKARTREWCTLRAQLAGVIQLNGGFTPRGYAIIIQSILRLMLALLGLRR